MMKNFLKETKELIFSQGSIAVISILQVSFTAKILGPSNYGIIALYLAITATIFRLLSSRNSDLVLLFAEKDKRIQINNFFKLETILGLTSFALVIVAIGILDDFLSLNFNQYSVIIFIFVFSRILTNYTEVFKGYFTHIGNLKLYSYFESGTVVIRFLLVIIFLIFNPTVEMYFLAISTYSIFSGVVSIFLVKKYDHVQLDSKIQFNEFFKLIKNSFIKLRIDQAIGVIPSNLDILIIGYYLNSFDVGIYQFAKKLLEPVNYMYAAFSPWMLNKLKQDITFKFNFLTTKVLLPISALLTLTYFSGGEILISTLGSNEFLNAYQPMLIMLLGYLFFFLTFWTRHFLLIKDSILSHTIARLMNTLTFLITSVFLLNKFSLAGAAIAVSLGIFVQKTMELRAVNKLRKNS